MVCVGTLCLVAQLSSLSHMLVVEHGYCDEHGAVEHLEGDHLSEAHASHAGSVGAAGESSEMGPTVAPERASESHGHASCDFYTETRGTALKDAVQIEAKQPPAPNSALRYALAEMDALLPLYSLAPKNSPPA